MVVLGIETSCDETSVAIVRDDRKILAHKIWSQTEDHAIFKGVVPEIAARAHMKILPKMVEQALNEAQLTPREIHGIAVTAGPGLIGGVIVGVMYAKGLSLSWNKPLLGVNHLAGHILSSRLVEEISFPYLCLLVSGGHSQTLYVKGINQVEILGETLDDAAGEAFDKGAKILGLPHPGGPHLERLAAQGDPEAISFPTPLQKSPQSMNFSFSGLKTSLLRATQKQESSHKDLAASYQKALIAHLSRQVGKAISCCKANQRPLKTFTVVGGVAANQSLSKKLLNLSESANLRFQKLPLDLCTDNAAMIAWAGIEGFKADISSTPSLNPRPRWPLTERFFA